ncbi:MAG TPA: pro-sigmaK processing inhibitor BofA family protein [Candidatus Deferrimicrobium sp.]|nr:pro-sigmaK processing inhibitor BofA family protein [Candidatus Deferrimicrobium sp.]
MSITLLLILVSSALGILLLGKLVSKPVTLIKKLVINSVIGLGILWILNSLGSFVAFAIPLNFFTVLVTGILGLPGVAMLGLIQVIVK